jgi:hypothetical protein
MFKWMKIKSNFKMTNMFMENGTEWDEHTLLEL